jgi:hypothetical protein
MIRVAFVPEFERPPGWPPAAPADAAADVHAAPEPR